MVPQTCPQAVITWTVSRWTSPGDFTLCQADSQHLPLQQDLLDSPSLTCHLLKLLDQPSFESGFFGQDNQISELWKILFEMTKKAWDMTKSVGSLHCIYEVLGGWFSAPHKLDVAVHTSAPSTLGGCKRGGSERQVSSAAYGIEARLGYVKPSL